MAVLADTVVANLMIDQTAVTDAGLLTLATIPTLSYVSAWNTQITDAGIEAALALPGRHPDLRVSN